MVVQSFFAIDNDNFVVTSSSSGGLVGNPVINNSDTPDGTVFQYSSGGGTTVTLNDTGGGTDTFNDDNEANHVITDGGGIVANSTEVEAESLIFVRALDGNGNEIGPEITIYVFSQNGTTGDVWGFATSQELDDGTSYVKTGGSNIGTSDYDDFITCFCEGTLIDTPTGRIAVEDIKPGCLVWTRDAGPMPVRWASKSVVAGTGANAPVVFAPGSIGNAEELIVSQQHRIWIESAVAELLFGQTEVLVAAKHLCGLPGVSLRPQPRVAYVHFMFDNHQIVRSNGALTESFFFAENAVNALERGARRELLALFPTVGKRYDRFGDTAAMTLTAKEAATLRPYLA